MYPKHRMAPPARRSIFIVLMCLFGSWAVTTILAAPGDIVTSQIYNQLFPNRNAFYSYQAFVSATGAYGAFGNTGSQDDQKRELAAFFAHVKHETRGLGLIEEMNPQSDYCFGRSAPCAPGKRYYGRGPLQLTWNYDYQACGNALGLDLINNPELLATNAVDSFKSALWFWMQRTNPTTCHDAITGGKGFGATIRIINGTECVDASKTPQANRITYFRQICNVLGVDPGKELGCGAAQDHAYFIKI